MKTLSIILKALWLYMGGFFSVILVYCLLIGIEQGIDVVVQCGEYLQGPGVFTLIAVLIWSYFVWYSSRILSYIKQQKQYNAQELSPISTLLHKHFPRIISFNCYVCLQAAIISLPTIYDSNKYILIGFIVFHNLLYFLMTYWLEDNNKKFKVTCIALIVIYIILFVILPVKQINSGLDLNPEINHQVNLKILFGLLFILEFLWLFFMIHRRKKVNKYKIVSSVETHKNETDPEKSLYEKGMDKVGFRSDFIFAEKNYVKWFTIFCTVAFSIYLAGILNIIVAVNIGSLAYVLLALGILVSVLSFVSFFSIKWSVNLFLLLLIWSIVIGTFNDPYNVRTVDSQSNFTYDARPETKVYLKRWFKQRIELMKNNPIYKKDKDKKFDAYIVLSNGGASRAGYWASYNMCRMQDISYEKDPKNSFKDHLLCLAGASGGSVGNASFYALLKAKHDQKIKEESFTAYCTSFYRKDFLVYPLAHLLGPDLFQHIIPMKFMDDRGDALERSLSESKMEYKDEPQYDSLLKWYFKKPLSEVFDQSGDLPVLYMNSTEVDNGAPAVISNVKLASKEFESRRTDMLQLVNNLKTDKNQKIDIRLSTAAILSSRFPYVSPAAKVSNRYFVDGGYFDNSGSGTIFEFAQQLIAFLNTTKKDPDSIYYKRFTFHILHFNNSEIDIEQYKDINPVTNDLASPFLTLLGIQNSNTTISNGVLSDYFEEVFSKWEQRDVIKGNRAIEYKLFKDLDRHNKKQLDKEEVFPMSWVLSEYQMSRMRYASDRENNKNLKRFSFMNLK